ncbi:amidohydrolase family protein [Qaidamihabitans albus]|uniref:amidohydrolase family protein n=1 Tax=Qaidamihabitans albus TaxID=2795733 RepID=UPI0018F2146E|nr:amidohydrolase family protein [Qaidamihabitans albus]
MLVDTHAHLLPRDYPADAPDSFPRMESIDGETARLLLWGATRFRARDVFFDAERRIAAQEESGVDVEVLTPMPPLLRYDLPGAEGLSLARHVNEFTATLCSADPGRLIGFGLVPMQDPDLAAAELAVLKEHGLRGVEVASSVLGRSIGDEQFLPFFTEAQRLDLAVFVHAMPAPTDRLPASAMGTYVVGLEGATAAASMITGGTAAACPELRISFSHAAGGFPLMLPRAQYFWGGSWNEEPPVPERAFAHDDGPSPLDYARRFYYDSMVFDRRAIRYLIDLLGHERLLVGSDFPAMPREEPAGRTLRSMELPDAVLADITWHNAFRWLGIEPNADHGAHSIARKSRSDRHSRGTSVGNAAGR